MIEEFKQSPDAPTVRMLSWARNSTLYRLGQRMMTERQLRDAIARKARQKFEGITDAQVKAVADSAVAFAHAQNGIDDTAYAEASTRAAVRSGKAKRAIAQKLSSKGIGAEVVTAALEQTDDVFAAIVLARKRGFGPFRSVELDDRRKAKEFSAFARNGFGSDIGRRVFDMSMEQAQRS